MEKVFVSGIKFRLIVLKMGLRLFFAVVSKWGFFKGLKYLTLYRKDNRNLLKTLPNRFVKIGNECYVVADLPAVNSADFTNYLIEDMEFVLEKKLPVPVFAIVCITSKCPFKCLYCYNSYQHQKTEKLDIIELESIIQQILDYGIKKIYLSGGEPMVRYEDLLSIIRKFGQKASFWLLTTGFGVEKEKVDELKSSGLNGVMVSLDSLDEKSVNSIKGSEKAFEMAVNAIQLFNLSGLPVTVDCVFSKDLLKEEKFTEFVDFITNAGADFVNCYTPKNTSGKLGDINIFSMDDYIKLENLTNQNLFSKIGNNKALTWSPDIWEAKRGCMGGKLFIYVDPEGNVHHCPFSKIDVGNVLDLGLEKIMKGLQKTPPLLCNTMKVLNPEK